jgi:hypothetical protein
LRDEYQQVLRNETQRTSGASLRRTVSKIAETFAQQRVCSMAVDRSWRNEELLEHGWTSGV